MSITIIDDPEVNKIIKKPTDENSKIWRYMDFPKFVSLLHKNLFLVQSWYLKDKFEGYWKKTNAAFDEHQKKLRRYTCVSCWQQNESESAHMWDVYPKSNNGIAIQSTFIKLRRSVEKVKNKNLDLYYGKVDYEESLKLMPGLTFEPYFFKKQYFEEDKEIRLLYQEMDLGMQQGTKIDFVKHGIDIKVDLDRLIESIIISPNADKWFFDLVQSVVDKYGLDKRLVKPSSLGEFPEDFEYNEEEKKVELVYIPYGATITDYLGIAVEGTDTSGNYLKINQESGQVKLGLVYQKPKDEK